MDAPPTFGMSRPMLGAWFFTTIAAIGCAAVIAAWRRRNFALAWFAATLVCFAAATAMRKDVDYAYLKRFDFLPSCLVAIVATWVGTSSRKIAAPRKVRRVAMHDGREAQRLALVRSSARHPR